MMLRMSFSLALARELEQLLLDLRVGPALGPPALAFVLRVGSAAAAAVASASSAPFAARPSSAFF
eukprot:8778675-Pyramimonas_sp.AAC.1